MQSAKRSKKGRSGQDRSKQGHPGRDRSAPGGSGRGGSGRGGSGQGPPRQGRSRWAERRNRRLIVGALVGAVALIVVAAAIGTQAWLSRRPPQAPETAQPEFGPVSIEAGKPIVFGADDAPVTVGLYEDFECPHCVDLEDELGATITELLRDEAITLELFPMTVVDPDGASSATANAMACAAAEGFGPGYHAGLFANSRLIWSDQQLIELGGLVGDPSDRFADCIRDEQHRGWVDSIGRAAEKTGVTGTPAVYINGNHQPEAAEWTPQQFRDQIQAAQ